MSAGATWGHADARVRNNSVRHVVRPFIWGVTQRRERKQGAEIRTSALRCTAQRLWHLEQVMEPNALQIGSIGERLTGGQENGRTKKSTRGLQGQRNERNATHDGMDTKRSSTIGVKPAETSAQRQPHDTMRVFRRTCYKQ